jgi:itaconate CoA-transferase
LLRPLSGVTVLTLEHAVAGPFATRQLADLGARIIKIEKPASGDFARKYDATVEGLSSYFVWLNRSKESVTLDVKTTEGREILHELVNRSDVLVQNLGPGAASRLGLDSREVRLKDPKKITLSITGWGSNGPWSQRKAYDLLVQSEAGLLSLTGSPDSPARVGISIADIAAGMYGFSGVLAALYAREVTGEGQAVEVSLFEALAEWMSQPLYYAAGSGKQPERVGVEHATIAPYGPFKTEEGEDIVVAVQNDAEWVHFCTGVLDSAALSQDPRFITNSNRVANRTELNSVISTRFSRLKTESIIELLEQSNIAYAGMNTMMQFLNHPVLQARNRWRSVDIPNGIMKALLPPIQFESYEARMEPVPKLGEHTGQLLKEIGHSASEIESLAERQII